MEKLIELKSGEHIAYDALIIKLATHLFVETSHETTTNNWTIYFEELEEQYELEEGFIDLDVANDIEEKLYSLFGEMVAECHFLYLEGSSDQECDRYFDITLYENYCLGYIQDDQTIEENRG